jgi:hypothetical protein
MDLTPEQEAKLKRLLQIQNGPDMPTNQGWGANGPMTQGTPEMANPAGGMAIPPTPGRPIGPPAIEGPDPMTSGVKSLEDFYSRNGLQGHSGWLSPEGRIGPAAIEGPDPLAGKIKSLEDYSQQVGAPWDTGLLSRTPPPGQPMAASPEMGNVGQDSSPSRGALMMQAPKKEFPGENFKPMEEGEVPTPIPPDDTAQRYQKALEMAQRLKSVAGGMSDLNDAAQMAMYSGSHIRAGVKPLRFGNAYDQAQASNAAETAQSIPMMADMDPNSARSQHLAEVGKSMGFGDKLKGMSASQMIKIFPFLAKAVSEKESESFRQQQLALSQGRFDETKANNLRKDLEKGSAEFQRTVNIRNNALQSARQARSAVNSGTQTGLAAVATLLQKAAGDTGNISQSEQAQYQHRVQVFDRMKDWITQVSTGGMTAERKKDILGLLDEFEKGNEAFVNDMADIYSNRYSYILGKDPEELKSKLFRPVGGPVNGGSAPAGGNTIHYKDAGIDYDIPLEKEGAFLRDHQKAQRGGHGG